MLSTTRLHILREVAICGSAAAAARALYLTPPAVTYQLAELEKEVGVPLLERTARSVRLTSAGQRMVEHADTILAECERALADVRSFSEDVRGTVRLSVFRAAAGGVTLAALLELRRAYPDLDVLTSDLKPGSAVSALKANQLDIAVDFEWGPVSRSRDASVDRRVLFTESMALLLPVGHPLAAAQPRIEDLVDEPWCVAQSDEQGRHVIQLVAKAHGFEPRVVFESDDFRAIGATVEAGLGIGIVPLMTDLRGVGVVMQPLTEPRMSRFVFAAVRRGSENSPAIRAVLDALAAPACAVQTHTLHRAMRLPVPDLDDVPDASGDPSSGSAVATGAGVGEGAALPRVR